MLGLPQCQTAMSWTCYVLEAGYRDEPMSRYQRDSFRADAKAEGDKMVLGGFATRRERDLSKSPWFAETLTKTSAPWVYERGEPNRVITSLELLTTLGCMRAFIPDMAKGALSTLTLTVITDNEGNSHLLSKLGSTKLPLLIILTELAALLLQKRSRLSLA